MQDINSLSLLEFLQIILLLGLPVYILGISFQIYLIYKNPNLKVINLPFKTKMILLFQIMAFGLTIFLWMSFSKLPESWFMIFNFILTPALVAEIILSLFFIRYLKTLEKRIKNR